MTKLTVANILKNNRQNLGLTQRQVGRKAKLNPVTISNLECGRGKLTPYLAAKLSRVLKIDKKTLANIAARTTFDQFMN